MQAEVIEIRQHLSLHEPFEHLPAPLLDKVAGQVEVAYFRAGSTILEFGQQNTDLHYIRSGAVEVYRRSGELYNRLTEGDIFGQFGLLRNKTVRFPVKAIEDTLIYCIPDEVFQHLWENDDDFADFVEIEDRTRLRTAVSRSEKSNDLMMAKVTRLISQPPVTAPSTTSIREAARIMTAAGVSSLVITAVDESSQPAGPVFHNAAAGVSSHVSDGAKGNMIGIVTDRDLRSRAIGGGLSHDAPIRDIMSGGLISIRSDAPIFDAMLTMLHNNVHHLPVFEDSEPRGVIGLSDIVRYESQSSLFVVSSIYRQRDVRGLKAISKDVKNSFVRMVNEDANSHMIGSAMAGIGRSFSRRLMELGEEKLGPPPVPYCLMALGSMARDEQLIVTDQDNAMVIDDAFDPALHDDYFRELAAFLSDGLAACGYSYCTGGIMATNQKWRQPLGVWKEYFRNWIEDPRVEALLNSSIFFDLDGIYGETAFTETLKSLVADKASHSQRFLALMARNALNRKPPLGFFRDFVVEKDGEQRNVINLKRRGTAPLSDLIRLHALAAGSRAQNSFARLNAIIDKKILPEGSAENLRDALEFIAIVRIRHQAQAIDAGRKPDNNVRPEDLSPFERRSLKDAFQVLSNGQKYLRFRYHASTGRELS